MDGIDTSVNATGLGQLRPVTTGNSGRVASVAPTAEPAATAAPVNNGANLISLLAEASPPVDSKTVDAIRSLIAQGRYPIDSHAIAAKMVTLDIGKKD